MFACKGLKVWEDVQKEGIKITFWTTEFDPRLMLECSDFDYAYLKLKYGEKIWPAIYNAF